jgi:hypothetical protein
MRIVATFTANNRKNLAKVIREFAKEYYKDTRIAIKEKIPDFSDNISTYLPEGSYGYDTLSGNKYRHLQSVQAALGKRLRYKREY